MDRTRRLVAVTAGSVAGVVVLVAGITALLWQQRATLDDIPIPAVAGESRPADAVVATWFGTSTLLFDDGETQILIDGFVSRPAVTRQLLGRPVESDAAAINRFMLDNRLDRLAAIIPAHTHIDHAFDIAAIANRSKASIVGSPSAVLIGRGGDVPGDQLVSVGSRTEFTFGEFTVTLIPSRHAPYGWSGSVPRDGPILAPFDQPSPANRYRAGLSFSIVITHPQGTAVVQASAGFIPGALNGVSADVVFLGSGMLEALGREYAEDYWLELVTTTGASRVLPIHFDDFSKPFGETVLMPRFIDDFRESAEWLVEFRSVWDRDARLELPRFGEAIVLYAGGEDSTGT